MLKALHQSFLGLTLCVTCLMTGCATTSTQSPSSLVERSPMDLREEQLSLLSDRVQRQDQMLEKLTSSLNALKSELEKIKLRTPAGDATAGLPIEKLTPQNLPGDPLDVDETEASEEQDHGETVADSSDQSMHYYYEGLKYKKSAQYDESIRALETFLKESPDHVYADRAEFQIADDYLRNHEYGLAVVATNKLEATYPRSFKLPDALLTRAMAYEGLGQKTEALGTLKDLMRRYPSDPAADSAAKKLAELSSVETNNPTSAPKLIDGLE